MDKRNLDTLSQAMNALNKEGFKESFKATDKGVEALSAKQTYKPQALKIVHRFRFDGMTNPADDTELLALVADDGTKGTMTISYSAESNHNDDIIRQIAEADDK